ncbi:Hsp70-binding protein 1 [Eumeta japonica]|uniref:Hsp70-binding protein 1 n=1 Tax=Eumeta variegata TaxID=151549 RepID=A0A4C1YFU4_EUMVA|nr:Hsp70-binding protein 1 [Eumeta japonica]
MGSNNHVDNSGIGTNAIAGAITFPTRNENSNDGNVQLIPSQPRQPTDLQGLLRFALEATKAEDAPGNSEFGPMGEEQRRFLEEAMKSLTMDVAELLRDAIKLLTDKERINSIQLDQPLPVDIKAAFDNLLEYVDDIDVAIDFYKMGGFAMFPICYGSENEMIRTLTSTLLGEVCQNNPLCQAKALEYGLLNILLNLAGTEKGLALTKTLFALSCTIRGYDPACNEFVAKNGCAILVKVLDEPECATRNKAFFLITSLCHNYPQSRVKFIETNLIASIAQHMKQKIIDETQIHLSILQSLIEESDTRLFTQMRNPQLKLKSTIEEILQLPELQSEIFSKERECCLQILTKVFSDESQVQEDGPDR